MCIALQCVLFGTSAPKNMRGYLIATTHCFSGHAGGLEAGRVPVPCPSKSWQLNFPLGIMHTEV